MRPYLGNHRVMVSFVVLYHTARFKARFSSLKPSVGNFFSNELIQQPFELKMK